MDSTQSKSLSKWYWLKKSKTDNKILFIDASAEFVHQGNKNKLTEANQAKILDAFTKREDADRFAQLVDYEAIKENGYNIAVSSYVDVEDTSEAVDIEALNSEIAQIVARQSELRTRIDAIIADIEGHRDSLLTFAQGGRVKWARMGEVGEFIRGRRFTKADVVPEGIASIHYGEIYTHYGVFASEALSHVRPELRPTLRFARTGDVVIAAVGETVEDVCKAVAWLGDEDVAIHDDCFAYRHTLNPKFVSYYFQTSNFHSEKNRYVARAKVKRISGESLAKLPIPVPPMEEQRRIVAILDTFHALVNNLSVDLPAEIGARRQQYGHYRDKLLSFKEET